MSIPPNGSLGEGDILELVRKRAERDLYVEGEQLTILDVYLPMPSDTRSYEWTVMVRWKRSDVEDAEDAIYTVWVKDGKLTGDIFGPEW